MVGGEVNDVVGSDDAGDMVGDAGDDVGDGSGDDDDAGVVEGGDGGEVDKDLL